MIRCRRSRVVFGAAAVKGAAVMWAKSSLSAVSGGRVVCNVPSCSMRRVSCELATEYSAQELESGRWSGVGGRDVAIRAADQAIARSRPWYSAPLLGGGGAAGLAVVRAVLSIERQVEEDTKTTIVLFGEALQFAQDHQLTTF
jgi:hypothetical protein